MHELHVPARQRNGVHKYLDVCAGQRALKLPLWLSEHESVAFESAGKHRDGSREDVARACLAPGQWGHAVPIAQARFITRHSRH